MQQPANSTGTPTGSASATMLSAEEARLQRNLKIVVAALGLLIFVGLATIAGRLIYLASSGETQPRAEIFPRPRPPGEEAQAAPERATGDAATAAARKVPNLAAPLQLQLPTGAEVRSVSLSGRQLAIHHAGDGGEGILVLDLDSGKVVARVDLERERRLP